jgi:hypothetical protein
MLLPVQSPGGYHGFSGRDFLDRGTKQETPSHRISAYTTRRSGALWWCPYRCLSECYSVRLSALHCSTLKALKQA